MTTPTKAQQLYEGKAKTVFATSNDDNVIIYYKDDATAGNGAKHSVIDEKGILNNDITTIIFQKLHEHKIKTHFIEKLNEREQLCEKVEIIPLEVIIRNTIAGSMAKRLGITEGTDAKTTIIEICYKNDDFGDPLINEYHAVALDLCSFEDYEFIKKTTFEINKILVNMFDELGIKLIDFKIEFGRNSKGEILLADEITPDTCRLWDKETNKKLDKDQFRLNIGSLTDAYKEVLNRFKK